MSRRISGAMKKALILPLFFACSHLALATDGNRLLQICGPLDKTEFQPSEMSEVTACTNYIDGVLDALVALQSAHPREIKSSVCAPSDSGINPFQGARIVLKYLRDNPDKLHWTASVLVINALHDTFPCR